MVVAVVAVEVIMEEEEILKKVLQIVLSVGDFEKTLYYRAWLCDARS